MSWRAQGEHFKAQSPIEVYYRQWGALVVVKHCAGTKKYNIWKYPAFVVNDNIAVTIFAEFAET